MSISEKITEEISRALNQALGMQIKIELEFPPDIELGDFTINCYTIAREVKKSPELIAKILSEKLKSSELIEGADQAGAYVNIKLSSCQLFSSAIEEVFRGDKLFSNIGVDKKIMVEYLSPNTNKPLHLGHLRNGCLGMALSKILESNGYKAVKVNLINDRGIHISKSILAWLKWGNGETPESTGIKGDHFVGKWYIKFNEEVKRNPKLENEAQEILQKWEQGDKTIVSTWQKMNGWVYEGFDTTYKKFGFEFDKIYYESDTYKLGKNIVEEGLKKKVFYQDTDGAIVADLPEFKEVIDSEGNKKRILWFGTDKNKKVKKVTLVRKDGTSLYMTQDLGTAVEKFGEYKLDKSICVVGSEQEYHFQALFAILQLLGYDFAKNCYHLSYGMVYLPEGKMKSREGTVVDADNLLDEVTDLVKDEITKRFPDGKIGKDEVGSRSSKIALGAIKFYLLRTNPKNDIYFDPKESISLEGFTGPYCQYAYARATKIIEKANFKNEKVKYDSLGNNEERILIQKIINLSKQITSASYDYNPTKVALGVYELAVGFNKFYQKHQVLNASDENLKLARLALVEATRQSLGKGLKILGIEAIDEM
ncbi:MAG: arginine--tRNA ligase [bacterium]|nr:arginine--tRNA ligase [bacterium]